MMSPITAAAAEHLLQNRKQLEKRVPGSFECFFSNAQSDAEIFLHTPMRKDFPALRDISDAEHKIIPEAGADTPEHDVAVARVTAAAGPDFYRFR